MWNATSEFIEEKDFDTGLYGNVNGEILIGGEKNFLIFYMKTSSPKST